jgi:hypothetical protein
MAFHTQGMAQNLPRSVYWRRRALVLGLAIGILALLAWTVTGMAGRGGQASQAGRITRVPRVAHHRQTADGPSARSADSPTAPPAAQAQARPVPTPTSGSAGLPAACKPSQVVLSLVPGEGSYGPHVHPQFNVYVVSIGKRDCSFNVGPRYLSVVIKSGGITRIWSSADCMKDMGSDFVPLSTGVPSVLHFSWDRKASSPGCRTVPVVVRPGTYTATVTAPGDHLASQGMIFILNGPGVAVP